ncbi:Cof-type HAD-IIB family hydrolase [Oceanobacillus oncorhynchi]|uniref:Putative bifunctional phosphatase/peptidyl-prolyl cis-trans isomerase n=1 Tax=Oceanobacillus oncorhynchi TaxID=545501 RepID=A0A0A1MBM6_9BACI|nr:Cof-type HAD-IIB family hydrolase [Oceanobacillus oncorhynchi]MDM8099100.1 Cof-type HAD-IIB family hydrolase [Oceanobacillus oncorhynchi]CEI80463.1 Putative bifunctional phosphatase/peptidyl-prolyl cis-trans isomerase [Oceanobacillus oncorhynchi]
MQTKNNDYKVCFLDIDGTLVNDNKQISNQTRKSLDQIRNTGVEVIIATGRPPYHFSGIAEELKVDSFVSFNGAYSVYKGKVVHKHSMDTSALQKLVEYAGTKQHPLVFSSEQKSVSNIFDHNEVMQTFKDLHLNYKPEYHPDYWKKATLFQAIVYCKNGEEIDYIQQFPDLSFVRWHEFAIDVMPHSISKASGVKEMLQFLNVVPEEAIAFGDGLNDKEMLDFVGVGIAMENAHKDLYPYADIITKSNENEGITHGLKLLKLL